MAQNSLSPAAPVWVLRSAFKGKHIPRIPFITTRRYDAGREKPVFQWSAIYSLIYGKAPDNHKRVVWDVLKAIPVKRWLYIPYLLQGLDAIGEVI